MSGRKLRVAILFGGRSAEHEISLLSARFVLESLDRDRYEPVLVGIDRDGRWLLQEEALLLSQGRDPRLVKLNAAAPETQLPAHCGPGTAKLTGVSSAAIDVVFPVLHGPMGEDGAMQGLLELAGLPYVGSGVVGSAVGMDKAVMKRLLEHAGIPVVPYRTVRRLTPLIDADFNGDDAVDASDYTVWRASPAEHGGALGLEAWRSSYGKRSTPVATTPEPGGGVLVAWLLSCAAAVSAEDRRSNAKDRRRTRQAGARAIHGGGPAVTWGIPPSNRPPMPDPTDPPPPIPATELRKSQIGWTLVYCAALVVTIAGLRAASSVFVPLLLAAFFSVNLAPPMRYLQKQMPFPAALAVVLLVLIGLFLLIPVVVGSSLQQLSGSLPQLTEQTLAFEKQLLEQLNAWELEVTSEELRAVFDPSAVTSWFGSLLNSALRLFSNGMIVLLMTAFMLTEAAWFSEKLAVIDLGSGDASRHARQVTDNVRRYVGIKTGVSLATGLCVWTGLRVLGVEYAEAWGFIAFLLNYVPTIGSIVAGVPPIFLALVQHGLGMALAVTVLYGLTNQIIGSVIEPRLQGRGLGLSPLVVFVSLLFWGWAFGPIGMLLSAPITMTVKLACEEFPETRWIAVMLGGRPRRSV